MTDSRVEGWSVYWNGDATRLNLTDEYGETLAWQMTTEQFAGILSAFVRQLPLARRLRIAARFLRSEP